MYVDAICGTYREHCELVALCDISSVRASYHNRRLAERHHRDEVPAYGAEQFELMLAQQRPDVVVVTTVDAYHHRYIIAAMEHGCDVISEKPMTIDAEKVAAILAAIEGTGRRLTVTFNYRYEPGYTRIRELVASGAIGTPRLVDFSWMLDTSHGADYFRRWHREKDLSGGLLVHKATHHFDLVNWWIESWPETVFAMGSLSFYGREAAAGRGERYGYHRYTDHAPTAGQQVDPFAIDLSRSPMLRGLYLEAERETGYLRDRNVFGDGISAEDTMVVAARYRGGALLSYSLVAYSPWEGLIVAITGDKGRIELREQHGAHILEQTPTGEAVAASPAATAPGQRRQLRLYPMFAGPVEIDVESGAGPHSGDAAMLEQIFAPNPPADPWGRAASHLDGAASVLLGAAANRAISTGGPVHIGELGVSLPAPVRTARPQSASAG